MKKNIKIEIPEICTKQEWSPDFISKREKLCLLCNEKVFDATSLTDEQLFTLVTSKEKPKCLKLKKSQVDRSIATYSHYYDYKQLTNVFYGLLVAGLVVSCSIQKQSEKRISDYEELFQTDFFFKDSLKNVVRGVVVDIENEEAIPNAFISIEGSSKGVKSDKRGYFKLEIPNYVLSDTITLKVQAAYKKSYYDEFKIIKDDLPLNKTFRVEEEYGEILLGTYKTIYY